MTTQLSSSFELDFYPNQGFEAIKHQIERATRDVWITNYSVLTEIQTRLITLAKNTTFRLRLRVDKASQKLTQLYELIDNKDRSFLCLEFFIYSPSNLYMPFIAKPNNLQQFKIFCPTIVAVANTNSDSVTVTNCCNKRNASIVEFIKTFTITNSDKLVFSFDSDEGHTELAYNWSQHKQRIEISVTDENVVSAFA